MQFKLEHIYHKIDGHLTNRLSRRKDGNVLFNEALNTFYFGYMASDIKEKIPLSERGNLLAPLYGLNFPISNFFLIFIYALSLIPHTFLYQSWNTGSNDK